MSAAVFQASDLAGPQLGFEKPSFRNGECKLSLLPRLNIALHGPCTETCTVIISVGSEYRQVLMWARRSEETRLVGRCYNCFV